MLIKDLLDKLAKLNGEYNEKRLIIEYFGSLHTLSYIQSVRDEMKRIEFELERLLNTEIILKE